MRSLGLLEFDPNIVAAHDEAYAHILGSLRNGRYKAGERLIAETIAA